MAQQTPNIAVIGAGIIGLSCAWELQKRGARVTLFDKGQVGLGASAAAAGMLAPAYEVTEAIQGNDALFDLGLQSAALWPGYVQVLEAASGMSVGYDPRPTLAVAVSEAEFLQLHALEAGLDAKGIAFDKLSAEQASTLEPTISGNIKAAIALPTDRQVDNLKVCRALSTALGKGRARFCTDTLPPPDIQSQFDHVLVATGPAKDSPLPVQPVKGAVLSLRPGHYLPSRTVRFGHTYIVPKEGRVIIGATMEPGCWDMQPDRAALGKLRQAAAEVCEGVAGGVLHMNWAGLRPALPDGAPAIGALPDGRFIATGHYRNGILLAPITAQIMADMMLEDKASRLAAHFSPDRFVPAPS